MNKKNQIRLYRFYNINHGKHGEPFAMCDKHKENYNVPTTCMMEKIADKSRIGCNMCESKEPFGCKETKV